jgi:small-conductance mechanosensitive channel
VFGHQPDWTLALSAIAIAIVLAWGLTQIVVSIVRRAIRRSGMAGPAGSELPHHRAARSLPRIVRIPLIIILTAVAIPPALDLFGQPLKDGLRVGALMHWLLDSGVRVLLISGLAVLIARLSTITIARLERYLAEASGPPAPEQVKRAKTIGLLLGNVARAFIFATAGLMILNELGVNTAPLLTGAGILGLAIGFGAQTLVKDVISGFFIILENQVRVGDTAEINGTGGLVEAITLRTIVLRDIRGAVHVFPCGAVTTLANLTKDYSYAVLDVHVDYRHDTDEVVAILREVAESVRQDPAFAPAIKEPLEVLGIENLTETGVTVRVRMKTMPQRQWDVTRELRRRIKKAFEAKGIDIPVVQNLVTTKR